jgi:uncharacterized cupredoxin-like copper-binding protein
MSIKKRIIPLLVVVLVAIPLLTACGSGSGSGSVDVTLDSYSIKMPSTIKAGQVTFHVSNISTSTTHAFIVVKTDLAPGKLPLDSNGNVDPASLDRIGGIDSLAPGASQDLTVTLQPGSYVAYCDLPGHYQAGMFTGFTVQ